MLFVSEPSFFNWSVNNRYSSNTFRSAYIFSDYKGHEALRAPGVLVIGGARPRSIRATTIPAMTTTGMSSSTQK
jgi:hypothetical protein